MSAQNCCFKAVAAACMVGAAWLVSACATPPENQAKIDSVITALPTEVEKCTFLGEVDSQFLTFVLEEARNRLKIQTANLGGNTLVETHLAVSSTCSYMYPDPWFDHPAWANTMNNQGFYLTGRAYYCPDGMGVKAAPHLINKAQQARSQLLLPAITADSEAAPAPDPNKPQPLSQQSQQSQSAPVFDAEAAPAPDPAPASAAALTPVPVPVQQ